MGEEASTWLDLDIAGEIVALTPEAEDRFPELQTLGLEHPLLRQTPNQLAALTPESPEVRWEEDLERQSYELRMSYRAEARRFRIWIAPVEAER